MKTDLFNSLPLGGVVGFDWRRPWVIMFGKAWAGRGGDVSAGYPLVFLYIVLYIIGGLAHRLSRFGSARLLFDLRVEARGLPDSELRRVLQSDQARARWRMRGRKPGGVWRERDWRRVRLSKSSTTLKIQVLFSYENQNLCGNLKMQAKIEIHYVNFFLDGKQSRDSKSHWSITFLRFFENFYSH